MVIQGCDEKLLNEAIDLYRQQFAAPNANPTLDGIALELDPNNKWIGVQERNPKRNLYLFLAETFGHSDDADMISPLTSDPQLRNELRLFLEAGGCIKDPDRSKVNREEFLLGEVQKWSCTMTVSCQESKGDSDKSATTWITNDAGDVESKTWSYDPDSGILYVDHRKMLTVSCAEEGATNAPSDESDDDTTAGSSDVSKEPQVIVRGTDAPETATDNATVPETTTTTDVDTGEEIEVNTTAAVSAIPVTVASTAAAGTGDGGQAPDPIGGSGQVAAPAVTKAGAPVAATEATTKETARVCTAVNYGLNVRAIAGTAALTEEKITELGLEAKIAALGLTEGVSILDLLTRDTPVVLTGNTAEDSAANNLPGINCPSDAASSGGTWMGIDWKDKDDNVTEAWICSKWVKTGEAANAACPEIVVIQRTAPAPVTAPPADSGTTDPPTQPGTGTQEPATPVAGAPSYCLTGDDNLCSAISYSEDNKSCYQRHCTTASNVNADYYYGYVKYCVVCGQWDPTRCGEPRVTDHFKWEPGQTTVEKRSGAPNYEGTEDLNGVKVSQDDPAHYTDCAP